MGEEVRCEWKVRSCSSEAEVHEASNALKSELYRVWQTAQPADEAWLVLEACPPSAFSALELVNSGSALVEVFGLPDDRDDDDDDYIMLLSAQQLMSTKDVINKANRNRSFTYTCSDKLSQLASQGRWKQVKILCRQPFGSEEQKTCIGLARLNFKHCKTSAELAADTAEAHLQENLKAGLAKMFPKGSSSAECVVVSQVTEPSRPLQTSKVEKDLNANVPSHEAESPSPIRGKRKLPTWQSPSKHTNKGDKGGGAGRGAVSSEEDEKIAKASQKRKATSKVEKPERKEPASKKSSSSKKQATAQTDHLSGSRRQEDTSSQLSGTPPSQITKGQDCSSPGPSQHVQSTSRPGTYDASQSKPKIVDQPESSSKRKEPPSSQNIKTKEDTQLKSPPQITKGQANSRPGPSQHVKGSHSTSRPGTFDASQSKLTIVDQPESSSKRKEPPSSQTIKKKEDTQLKSPPNEGNKRPVQSSPKVHKPSQANAITLSFSKFLDGVFFAISGLVNPERAEIRDKALQMGGQYRPDWSADCTLLICAFANTPKFNQVKNDNGTIVSKVWIQECYQQKKLVDIENYLMHAGKPWRQIEASFMDDPDDECSSPSDHDRNESMTTLASLKEVEKWVHEDVASSITWLKQQEVQPEAQDLRSVAVQGIQLCLDDTVECLRNKQSIKKIMESWDYVPRAVRELAGREDKAGKARKENFWSDMLCEAERLKWIYSKELEKVTLTKEQCIKQASIDSDDDDTEDAATDVIHDDASSEDTQVLDEDDIREAKETISKIISGF